MTSGLPWFRVYNDIIDDEIVTLLSFEDRWHFVAFMCLKCKGVTDKKFPSDDFRDRAFAKKLGLDIETFKDARARLIDAGLIDRNGHPIAWEKRQMRSDIDPTNAQRQARYREKKKRQEAEKIASNVNSNGAVTELDKEGVTQSNKQSASAPFLSEEKKHANHGGMAVTNNAESLEAWGND